MSQMSQLVNLQDDGFCNGLSDANKAIAKARNSTRASSIPLAKNTPTIKLVSTIYSLPMSWRNSSETRLELMQPAANL
jgi:hypothetical protein